MRRVHAIALLALGVATFAAAPRAGALQITRPSAGASVTPGSTVHVEVVPAAGEVVQQLHATALGDLVAAAPGALSLDVPVPADAVGPLAIMATARLASGQEAFAAVDVVADPGPLDHIEISAPLGLTHVGQVAQLEVRGFFADGVARDLTHPDRGTTYESSDPNVLGADPSGLVQARTHGTAQILVLSRGRSATATVRVEVPNPPDDGIPTADAGPDQSVARETLVTLDGTASRDPDGDALHFTWEQTAGTLVVVRDTDTAHPYFVSPFVTASEVLEFSVVVEDPHGARSFPARVRVTVTPP
jgi:hypothetical protein